MSPSPSLHVPLLFLLTAGALLAPATGLASPPKAKAPVDVQLSTLDPVTAGQPVRLRLQAVPRVDAPLLRLTWLLPPGVASEGGPLTWSGPVTSRTTAELTVTVRLPDLTPRTFFAGATIEYPDGSRQVRSCLLEVPPGPASKSDGQPPVTRNSRGEAIVEHLVPSTARSGLSTR